jgi:uncharacterized membrane protein
MYYSSLTDQNTEAFKEVAIISHPRVGEYAFGFITSTMILQVLIYRNRLLQMDSITSAMNTHVYASASF